MLNRTIHNLVQLLIQYEVTQYYRCIAGMMIDHPEKADSILKAVKTILENQPAFLTLAFPDTSLCHHQSISANYKMNKLAKSENTIKTYSPS